MLNPKTDIEWIAGFLHEKLSALEVTDFQKRLETDADFAALFAEEQLLSDGIRLARMTEQVQYFQGLNVLAADEEIGVEEGIIGEAVRVEKNLDVLERFRERGKVLDEEKVIKKSPTIRWWSLAAGILFLLGFSWYFFLSAPKSNYQLLAEKYNEPYPAFGITKGTNEDLQKNQQLGLQLYASEKYQDALPLFKKSLQNNKYYENSLYISVCYLKTNQLDSAYIYLQNTPILIPELTDATKWYLAIYYLKREDIPNCLQMLDLLTQSDALEFKRKAIALQEALLILQHEKK